MNDSLFRIGICKHTGRKILQLSDPLSDDAVDEAGWLCLHEDTVEEEIQSIINFKYDIDLIIISS